MTGLAVLAAWIGLGSAAGGVARFLVSEMVARVLGDAFPFGTLLVNVSGAFAIGIAWRLAGAGTLEAGDLAWEATVTGFLGSYTTVSAFSLQTLALARAGHRWRAAGNVTGSVVLALGAVLVGAALAEALVGPGR